MSAKAAAEAAFSTYVAKASKLVFPHFLTSTTISLALFPSSPSGCRRRPLGRESRSPQGGGGTLLLRLGPDRPFSFSKLPFNRIAALSLQPIGAKVCLLAPSPLYYSEGNKELASARKGGKRRRMKIN